VSDIVLQHLLEAKRRERSFLRRLLLEDDHFLRGGIEQVVRSACMRVELRSQHERVTHAVLTRPASERHAVTFYERPRPDRPEPGRFEERSEEFALLDSLDVHSCPGCAGSGRVPHVPCVGRGVRRCDSCDGRGQTREQQRIHSCSECSGAGFKPCWGCQGSGRIQHGTCAGEGLLACWAVEQYSWRVEDRLAQVWPVRTPPKRLRRALRRWLRRCGEEVRSFEEEQVRRHLGFWSAEAATVLDEAVELRDELDAAASSAPGRRLFASTTLRAAPTSYTVHRDARRSRHYFRVGRGVASEQAAPPGRVDLVKVLAWAALAAGVWLGSAAVGWVSTPPLSPAAWALVVAVGGVVAGATARRVAARQRSLWTVALVRSGPEVPFLACAAAVGSLTGRFRVLDRTYDRQLAALLGMAPPDSQSNSVVVELADGERICLFELADASQLTAQRAALLLEAVDAVVVLDAGSRPQDDLHDRLQAAREITTVVPVDLLSHDLKDGPHLPLAALRTALVDRCDRSLDWSVWADRLLAPLLPLERS